MAAGADAMHYYDLLGVPRHATVDEIKRAFKRAAMQHHPDKGGDPEKFKEANAAHETLADDRKRAIYDSSLIRARSRDGLRSTYDAPRTDFQPARERVSSTGPRDRMHSSQSSGRPDPFGSGSPFGFTQSTGTSPFAGTSSFNSDWGRSTTFGMNMPSGAESRRPGSQMGSHGPMGSQTRTSSTGPGPAPAPVPVRIPEDPSSLSVKELRELLTKLGMDQSGCVDKDDLLDLVRRRQGSQGGQGRRGPSMGPDRGTPDRGTSDRGTPDRGAGSRKRSTSPTKAPHAGYSAPPPTPPPPSGPPGRGMRIKVLALGSSEVGKSSLLRRFGEGRFVPEYAATIGVDYSTRPLKVMQHDIKVKFYDVSGSGDFKKIRTAFYDHTMGAMLVYDVTKRESFADLPKWIEEAAAHKVRLSKQPGSESELPYVVLCANKSDLSSRVVTEAEGMQFACQHGMYYYETSASSGEGVSPAFDALLEKVVSHQLHYRKRLGAG
eukprot:TRINITY_DN57646_c0_g1_i1.p1 TRINITY_DN57646_c0_g1~~TRINITY_DN57646_c0_g1_i1.p1  ORF type:complete len:491 (+),score=80.60 TRINITY_DN57646_c0_g1_i1:82-1554(+)